MGLPRKGYDQTPEHRAAMARTLAACRAAGKLACVNVYSMSDAEEKFAQRFDAVTFKSEADLLAGAGQSLFTELRTRADATAR